MLVNLPLCPLRARLTTKPIICYRLVVISLGLELTFQNKCCAEWETGAKQYRGTEICGVKLCCSLLALTQTQTHTPAWLQKTPLPCVCVCVCVCVYGCVWVCVSDETALPQFITVLVLTYRFLQVPENNSEKVYATSTRLPELCMCVCVCVRVRV